MTASPRVTQPVGELLRGWRQRRNVSQLALGLQADVSARHLSFVETGRARPSRELVLQLAEQLEVPLRERNAMLLAAGFAPAFPERSLDDPALAAAREPIELLLGGHEPYPALVVNRHWNLMLANRTAHRMMQGVAPALLVPPVNVLRLSLHPEGVAPRIANLAEWRAHLFTRLRHQIQITGDATLAALLRELEGYPAPGSSGAEPIPEAAFVVPLRLENPAGRLNLMSTTMIFGTPLDITLSELALETFLPADRRRRSCCGSWRPRRVRASSG